LRGQSPKQSQGIALSLDAPRNDGSGAIFQYEWISQYVSALPNPNSRQLVYEDCFVTIVPRNDIAKFKVFIASGAKQSKEKQSEAKQSQVLTYFI